MKSHDPVSEAYRIIRNALYSDEHDLQTMEIAMEEAIGYLGEALDHLLHAL